MAQFSVNSYSVEQIINWIRSKEIAIPEIQRPFVWDGKKVRDLIDSLYKGFPIGYIVTWKNPNIKLKDGTISQGKKILIDGQQRVTALQTAIAMEEVLNNNYQKKRIKIAFNPLNEKFEVSNPAINKDKKWIADIAEIFSTPFDIYNCVENYCRDNDIKDDKSKLFGTIQRVQLIKAINLGVIELSSTLSIEEVTEIFIRINSKGVVLSQADFAMSKISSDERFCGSDIRKTIDYFCHFIKAPNDYASIVKNDKEFAESPIHTNIKWVLKEQDDIYMPSYNDVLRVAFTHKFLRGKIEDLVSLLSGRNFETRENIEEVAQKSFYLLKEGTDAFVNETNFKRYLMILHSIGIINKLLTRSQNVLNFGYILYLALKDRKVESYLIEKIVRKWIVLSMLTGRYSVSQEDIIEADIKKFMTQEPMQYLQSVEERELSDIFWHNTLVEKLNVILKSSPVFIVFLMAQIKMNARGFLSKNITVRSLIEQRGDAHHLFPRDYLKKNGYNSKKGYNQVANYVYTQSEINIKIKNKSPKDYMENVEKQMKSDTNFYGEIDSYSDLLANLKENCIPEDFIKMTIENYEEFLKKRCLLMADYIKTYYESLS